MRVQLHSFVCAYPVFLTPFVEKIILSPLGELGIFFKDNLAIYELTYFWVFYSIPLVYLSVYYNPVFITLAL